MRYKMKYVAKRKLVLMIATIGCLYCVYQFTYTQIPTIFSAPTNDENYTRDVWYLSNRSAYQSEYEVNLASLTYDKKHILWPRPHRWMLQYIPGFDFKNCQVKTCKLHVQEDNYYSSSDAVIISHAHYIPTYVRPLHQIWVFMMMESPHNAFFISRFGDNYWKRKINWTMTYRLDSDIILGYGSMGRSMIPRHSSQSLDAIIKKKTKQVAWVVSHCITPSNRESYVKELSKYIQVDVFGGCGNINPSGVSESFFDKIEEEYKFYLAFENSVCQDYVTEKFFRLQSKNLVLVVMGGANYSLITPNDTYINVKDFQSPKQLAYKLLYLDQNDSEYIKYLERKSMYTTLPNPNIDMLGLCELCANLHQPYIKTKTYDNIYEWFSVNKCSSKYDIWFISRLLFRCLYLIVSFFLPY